MRKGFTLIELLVVIVIIGVLATLATVAVNGARTRARDSKRVSDLKQISTALEMYYTDYTAYPNIITPGQPLTSLDGTKTYMAKVPNNPTPRAEGACADLDYQYSAGNDNYSLIGCLSKAVGDVPAGARKMEKGGQASNLGLADSLVGWWLFDEGSGGIIKDSSGQGRDAQIYSTSGQPKPSFVSGVNGTALEFTNTGLVSPKYTQYVTGMDTDNEADSPYNFNENTSFTIMAWAKYPHRMYGSYAWTQSGYYNFSSFGIAGKGYSASYGLSMEDYSTILPLNSEGWQAWSFAIRGNVAGSDAPYMARSAVPKLDTWTHIVGVYEADSSTNRYIRLYVDGSLKVSTPVNSNFIMNSSVTRSFFIGHPASYTQGNKDFFNGSIDDVRIYNRALSGDEVSALYNATR